MITDEELAQLPEDPELAFVEVERIMRANLNKQEQRASHQEYSPEASQLEVHEQSGCCCQGIWH